MNLLISIDEEIYRHAQNVSEDSNDEWNVMRAIANGTPIPDNATNGDVVKAMFPNASFYYHKASDIDDDYVSVCIDDCDTQQDSRAWWNAPYQKGGK